MACLSLGSDVFSTSAVATPAAALDVGPAKGSVNGDGGKV